MTILAANNWRNNAALIADVAKLYLDPDMLALDPTFGRGKWWDAWHPTALYASDLKSTCPWRRKSQPDWVARCDHGRDFRKLDEYWGLSFDLVAFDPPYVSKGGRATSGISEFDDRYGLHDAASSPADLQLDIDLGMASIKRVLKPRGILLVKCKDYISSGELWEGTFHTQSAARALGFRVVDRFEHYSKAPGIQPPGRRQVHARRNLSTLFVLEAPRHVLAR